MFACVEEIAGGGGEQRAFRDGLAGVEEGGDVAGGEDLRHEKRG
jgi:hypothetical protein